MKVSNIEVKLIDYCGSDLSVVNAARVSFHKESTELQEKDDKLINYLAKHKHKSPFNHSFITFRVKAPIFVARQLVKHKFMPWNEVSRRYVDDEPEFYFPKEYRKKAENVKQGSSNETVYNLDENFSIKDVMELDTTLSLKRYLQLLDTGMCVCLCVCVCVCVWVYRDWETDRKSTRLNSSHITRSRMPSSA